MKTSKRVRFKVLQVIGALVLGQMVFGQACGQFKTTVEQDQSSHAAGNSSTTLNPGLPKDFEAKPNTVTASVTYARQTLDSLISCTGIKTSDATIDAEFNRRKGSLSEYGYATQITGPMLMASAAIAGEVCNKLIVTEAALTSGQRRIFNEINFSTGAKSISSRQLRDVTRRLARSCWSRNETDEEFNVIESGALESFGSLTTAASTKAEMLMVCTSMLSSLSGVEM